MYAQAEGPHVPSILANKSSSRYRYREMNGGFRCNAESTGMFVKLIVEADAGTKPNPPIPFTLHRIVGRLFDSDAYSLRDFSSATSE